MNGRREYGNVIRNQGKPYKKQEDSQWVAYSLSMKNSNNINLEWNNQVSINSSMKIVPIISSGHGWCFVKLICYC